VVDQHSALTLPGRVVHYPLRFRPADAYPAWNVQVTGR